MATATRQQAMAKPTSVPKKVAACTRRASMAKAEVPTKPSSQTLSSKVVTKTVRVAPTVPLHDKNKVSSSASPDAILVMKLENGK